MVNQCLTLPWLARTDPSRTTRAFARSDSFRFRASAEFVGLTGNEVTTATLGTGLIMPSGIATVQVDFFLVAEFSARTFVLPGPGSAVAQCALDFFAFRRMPLGPGGAPSDEVFTRTLTLLRGAAPVVMGSSPSGRVPLAWQGLSIQLATPTQESEPWQMVARARAEAGGTGYIAGADSTVSASLYFIRVRGR